MAREIEDVPDSKEVDIENGVPSCPDARGHLFVPARVTDDGELTTQTKVCRRCGHEVDA